MRRIGIDKRDPEYRHFYYDDSKVLTSNPPKYEVHYVNDESDVDYVECSNVIKIKDAPLKEDEKQNTSTITIDSNHDGKPDITITSQNAESTNVVVESGEQKKRGRKKKVVDNDEDNKEEEKPKFIIKDIFATKFEYNVFDILFDSSNDLMNKLNEYGSDGWELCSSEIYKEGLIFDKKRIFCIMKRIKRKGLE